MNPIAKFKKLYIVPKYKSYVKKVFRKGRRLLTFFFIAFIIIFIRLESNYDISFYASIALFTMFYLLSMAFSLRIELLIEIDKLGERLDFNRELHIIYTPKLLGTYKKHRYKIEYWYKTTGRAASFVRTYFKLYLGKKSGYGQESLKKFKEHPQFKIIALKYVPEKNYLLMKVNGDIIKYDDASRLMDYLYSVSLKAK